MSASPSRLPAAIILMGVCGSGKTLIGQRLSQQLGGTFADADDFHSDATREKMRAGTPLTDDDRWPWLERLRQHILAQRAAGQQLVLACSALKEGYRKILSGGDGPALVAYVHLHGSAELIRARMSARQGHYMPVSLLESQLAILETPQEALRVDIDATQEDIVHHILQGLAL
jgi:gluconokinase